MIEFMDLGCLRIEDEYEDDERDIFWGGGWVMWLGLYIVVTSSLGKMNVFFMTYRERERG